MGLTREQLQSWEDDGYLVVPGVLSDPQAAVAELEQLPDDPENAGLRRHAVDGTWGKLAAHRAVVPLVQQLLSTTTSPRILQTMYLNKAAHGGVGVALHQDTHYIPFDGANTLLACWLACLLA